MNWIAENSAPLLIMLLAFIFGFGLIGLAIASEADYKKRSSDMEKDARKNID